AQIQSNTHQHMNDYANNRYRFFFFFFQAEDGIRDRNVTGVQTCALPIFSLSPFTTFSTPGGAPASSISSASRKGQDGSFSEGLRMKLLPQAIAIGNIHIGTIAGKLKGVIPAHTPSGCRIEYRSMPAEMLSENSPFMRCGIPQANSTTSRPRWIEPLASESTLPCSEAMRSASSS